MPLSPDQESYLTDLLGAVGEDPIAVRGWDRTFMDDIQKGFDEHSSNMMMTPPMWRQIERIGKSKFDLNYEDYKDG